MIVVIGIGQTLRGDDGAGIRAVQRWQAAYPATASHPQLRVELEELPGLSLLDRLSGADAAILVDAVRSGAPPGCLYRLELSDLDAFRPEFGLGAWLGCGGNPLSRPSVGFRELAWDNCVDRDRSRGHASGRCPQPGSNRRSGSSSSHDRSQR